MTFSHHTVRHHPDIPNTKLRVTPWMKTDALLLKNTEENKMRAHLNIHCDFLICKTNCKPETPREQP